MVIAYTHKREKNLLPRWLFPCQPFCDSPVSVWRIEAGFYLALLLCTPLFCPFLPSKGPLHLTVTNESVLSVREKLRMTRIVTSCFQLLRGNLAVRCVFCCTSVKSIKVRACSCVWRNFWVERCLPGRKAAQEVCSVRQDSFQNQTRTTLF